MRKIYVFGEARESLPQIMVLEGERGAKELLPTFLILSLSLLNLLQKSQMEENY